MNFRGIVLACGILLFFSAASSHAAVTGAVIDTGGSPVSGATVVFTDESDPEKAYSAITGADGKYEATIASVGVGDAEPAAFSLGQNYPNPFNPSTVIPFMLAKAGRVELVIFNIAGQRIKTLLSGHMPSGSHTVSWKGGDDRGASVAAGLYLYRLVSEGKSITRKMLLLDGGGSFAPLGSAARPAAGSSASKVAGNAYTVTITGDGIDPFEERGMVIEDGKVYDFTVQRKAIRVPADYPTIAEAIAAAPEGGTVLVAAGTYTENLVIGRPLTLRGEGMGVTTIKGKEIAWDDEGGPAVHITGDNVTVAGFTITGGYPGVMVDGESAVLEANNIIRNRKEDADGLGILVTGNACMIRNNLIVHNGETYNGEGAGVKAISVQSLVIENNTICDNAGANGGDVGNGYGIYARDSQGIILNNIIADNDAWDGPNGGVKGYGIYLEGAAQFRIDYNNVWDNDDDATRFNENAVKTIANYYGTPPGEHDISRDPVFVDREEYRLKPQSPCLDAGDPESGFSREPASNGGRINLGAYGNTALAAQTVLLADAGSDRNVFIGTTVPLDGGGSKNPFGGSLSYRWSMVTRPQGSVAALSDSAGVKPSFTPDIAGTYTIHLVVGNGEAESDPDIITVTAHRSGFSEDFGDGIAQDWKPVTGTWAVAGGYYTVSSSGPKTSTSYYDDDFGNFELEVKIRKTVAGQKYPTDNVGIFFHGDPGAVLPDGNWKNGYSLVCGSGQWNLSKYVNGTWSSVIGWTTSSQVQNSLGVWNVLKLRYRNGAIEFFINDVLQISYEMYPKTFTSGKIGLKMYDDGASGKGEIDYITVTPLIGN
jgi:hypothetical protein